MSIHVIAATVALVAFIVVATGCRSDDKFLDAWGNAQILAPDAPSEFIMYMVVGHGPDDIRAVYIQRTQAGVRRATAQLSDRGLKEGAAFRPLPTEPVLYVNRRGGIQEMPLPRDRATVATLRLGADPSYNELLELWKRGQEGEE